MLQMNPGRDAIATAVYLCNDVPPYEGEAGTVEAIHTHFDAGLGAYTTEEYRVGLDEAAYEIAAFSGLTTASAREGLLHSSVHTGHESPLQMSQAEPCHIEAGPLAEIRLEEAQAKQRAYELSRQLPGQKATVTDDRGVGLACYISGALYSADGERRLTPSIV